jgi:surface-anchored protein
MDVAGVPATAAKPEPRLSAAPGGTSPLHSAVHSAVRSAPIVIERGHLDLVEVTVVGGDLVLSAKDHTTAGGPTFRAPNDLQVRVGDRSRTAVPPGGAFGFLGPAGSTVHLLPQTEDPNLVWPGWSTERLTPGQVAGDAVTWRLRSVDGPGAVALFTTDQFGAPSVVFDSDDLVPDQVTVRINTHAHANWAFAAPGAYRLTFEVAADVVGRGSTATTATYVFLVGDGTAAVAPDAVPPPQQGVVPSAPVGAPAVPPGSGGAGGPGATVRGATVGASSGSSDSAGGATGGSEGTGIGALPLTGTSTVPMTFVGVLLLLLGAVGVVVGRSARSPRRTEARPSRGS